MDILDKQILNILHKNGRITHEEISKQLNMSRPAIHQRISKLEQQGIIEGYRTKINWSKLGYSISAYISLKVKTTDFYKLMNDIVNIKIENVVIEECHRATGTWCIILKVRTLTPDYITKLHDRLLKNECIIDSSTVLLLSSIE